MSIALTVVGSINLDLVLRLDRLPRPGETVTGGELSRFPGGKGANQAVAAAKLGANVRMIGAVGDDGFAAEALVGLHEAGVQLDLTRVGTTGVAMIYVDAQGETEIAVAPGANAQLPPQTVSGAVLAQLEVPDAVVRDAARSASFFALNAAPARPIDVVPDLLVVNRLEHEVVAEGKLVAVTYGADGAALFVHGREIARARPPKVTVIDGTAAGDAFTACLVVSLLEGRGHQQALERACAAGALAATKLGAQPSLPTAAEVGAILAA
jgi:ribokinase